MPRVSVEDVTLRAKAAWLVKDQWRSQLDDAYSLAMPMRNLYDQESPGAVKNDRVFDSTLSTSTVHFANRVQSNLVPAGQKWAKLFAGPMTPSAFRDEMQKLLDETMEIFFALLATSNFDTAVNEFLLDLAVGLGVMLILPGTNENPLQFTPVPQVQVALQEGPWNTVTEVYRKHELEARNVERQWPDMDKPTGWDAWLSEANNRNKKIQINEATYQEENGGPWYYDVVLTNGVGPFNVKPIRIVEREYKDNPWIIARWVKVSGEVQGRGPVLFALPDAKVLNKLKELILRHASLAVAGIWAARDDGVLNPRTVRIVPGAVIPVQSTGGQFGSSLQPLRPAGDLQVAELLKQDLTANIKKVMLDDKLPEDTAAVKSATEIMHRIRELQQDIGAPFGRLITEFIQPLLQRCLNILLDLGFLNRTIQGIGLPRFQIDGRWISVQVNAPLAQSQNLNEVEAIVQWAELNNAINPQAFLMRAKTEMIPEVTGLKLGIPQKLIREEDEQQAIALAAQQIAAAAAEQQQQIPVQQQTEEQPVPVAAAA